MFLLVRLLMKKILRGFLIYWAVLFPVYGEITGIFAGGHGGGELFTGTHSMGKSLGGLDKKTKKIGLSAGISGGYLTTLSGSKILVGAEVFLTILGAQPSTTYENGDLSIALKVKQKGSIGFAALGGMMINPKVALYAKGGYEINKLGITLSGNNPFSVSEIDYYVGTPSISKEIKTKGPIAGVGGFYKVSNFLLVGAEYVHTFFEKVSPFKTSLPQYSFSPTSHRVLGRVLFIF